MKVWQSGFREVWQVELGGEFGGGVRQYRREQHGAVRNALLQVCFLREAPETAIGSDRRVGKWGVLVPATQQMMGDMMKTSSVPATANDVMLIAMTGGAIGGVLISCVYPILTLVILNRPATQEWFAARPA